MRNPEVTLRQARTRMKPWVESTAEPKAPRKSAPRGAVGLAFSATYRLPPDLQGDLEWFWCEEESELGVCSNASSTLYRLERSTPSEPRGNAADGIRLALDLTWSHSKDRRWARQDDEIRALWYTLVVHESHGGKPMESQILRSPGQRDRSARVGSTIRRLVSSVTVIGSVDGADVIHLCDTPSAAQGTIDKLRIERARVSVGASHERVLFRVYGNPVHSRCIDDTSVLAAYASGSANRSRLLAEASYAYAHAHAAVREERKADRRRAFDAARGATTRQRSEPSPSKVA